MIKQDIKVAADSVVFAYLNAQLNVLLIQRKNEPFKGMWALPGGFVEDGEDLEPAARRELEEETSIRLSSMQQLRTYGKPGRDPRMQTVSIVFTAMVDPQKHAAKAADDAAAVQWFDIKELPKLAFDHEEIIEYAVAHFSEGMN